MTKQNAFVAQRVVAPKKLLSEQNPPSARSATNQQQQQQQLKPLVPIPLTCSPGLRRSAKTTLPLTSAVGMVGRQQPPRVVLPDSGRYPNAGKPVSPLISPTRRSLSPKEVVKGAYVRMQDPTECLETSLDEICKSVVKRSDSYRQANANSPRLSKSPNMLMALQKCHTQGNHFTDKTDIW